MRILRGAEHAPLESLRGRRIAVVGFGNQGRAHALCLRESGLDVVVGGRPGGEGARQAAERGFEPLAIAQAVGGSSLAIVALPDHVQAEVYAKDIAPHLEAGAVVGFLHGFTIRFGLVEPAPGLGVVMVAPKGPGETLRRLFREGRGLPCLFAVHQETPSGDAEAIGLAWAGAIGCARAGIIFTSFADEAETDLFGEQAVLCGGLSELVRAAFETLVDAGYPPPLAYLECCHEVKQIADLIYARGLASTYEAISSTAEFGTYRAGPRLVGEGVRRQMKRLLREIRDGTFARALRDDHERGFEWYRSQKEQARTHPIEPAGQVIRSLMPWLADGDGT